MDTDLLVENKIDDGQRLLNELVRNQFEVSVAFWAKRSEEGLWHLWIASSAVDANHAGEALSKVYAAMTKIPDCQVTPMDISVVNNMSPIAMDAIAVRDRRPSRKLVRFSGRRLGNLETQEGFIYPRVFPWEVRRSPDGHWEVLISESDDVWLGCDSEEEARAIAAAPVLQYEALDRVRSDSQFKAELQKTADVMEKYRMGFGSRFLRRRAQELRQ
jgi:hypothetical protein